MDPPYSIALLSRPLDSDKGRTLVSPVYTLRNGKKRKRHEVAVGVDGESVNIYNIQRQTLVSSYALPPETYLCCPPVSIYARSSNHSVAARKTFLLAKSGSEIAETRLLFIEEEVANVDEGVPHKGLGLIRPTVKAVVVPCAGAVGLDIVPTSQSLDPHAQHGLGLNIVATFSNGDIWIYDHTSGKSYRQRDPSLQEHSTVNIRCTTLIDFETAISGFLRHRKDITAMLGVNRELDVRESTLLYSVVQLDRSFELRLCTIRPVANLDDNIFSFQLRTIASHVLRFADKDVIDNRQFQFLPSMGLIYYLTQKGVALIDFSHTIPRERLVADCLGSRICGFIPLTASLVVTVTKTICALYETTYGTVLAATPLISSDLPMNRTHKRKRNVQSEIEPVEQFVTITAFTDLRMVVGVCGHELKALQLGEIARSFFRRRDKGTLLSEVIGSRTSDSGVEIWRSTKKSKWIEWLNSVDKFIEAKDVPGLERFVLKGDKLGSSLQNIPHASTMHTGESTAIKNGQQFSVQDLQNVDQRKALYILANVLEVDNNGQIHVRLRSLKLLEWLNVAGYLSLRSIQNVFPRKSLHPGEVARAIARFDETFGAMRVLLSTLVQWQLVELVEALSLLLRSFKLDSDKGFQRYDTEAHALENGIEHDDEDSAQAQLIREAEKAAYNELEHTSEIFLNGLETRRETVRLILSRLHGFHRNSVASTMRSVLKHEELILLLELLRLELTHGGWTSQYIEAEQNGLPQRNEDLVDGYERLESSDQAVQIVGDLLNCAIDAIGTNGWLVGLSGHSQRAKELIENLRAEVSAALEGCYEADMMDALLNTAAVYSTERKLPQQKSHLNATMSILPLGRNGKPAKPLIADQHQQRKDKLTLVQERSRAVGKYSVDYVRI